MNKKDENEEHLLGVEYVNDEIVAVEKEQEELDKKAMLLEKDLRNIMNSSGHENGSNAQEDEYLRQWFLLINQKSALIHRQLELDIL